VQCCRWDDACRCSGASDDGIAGVTKLAFKKRDGLADLGNSSDSDEAAGLGGVKETDVEVDRRAIVCAAGLYQDRWSQRVIQHRGNEAALDVAPGIAKGRAPLERDLNGAAALISLNQFPPEGLGARWLWKLIENTHEDSVRDRKQSK
jgi:hypothetical protein